MKKDIQKLYKILDESVNKIKKHILNEGDEIQNFKNGIKNEDNDIKFIQKGLGELAINLIEKEVKKKT